MPTLNRQDERTKTALERSIAKWEANTKAEYPHQFRTGPRDCALCNEFQGNSLFAPCSYCPVYRKTGANFCRGTPYEEASRAHNLWVLGATDNATEEQLKINAQAAAREEVEFLKSLREQEPTT